MPEKCKPQLAGSEAIRAYGGNGKYADALGKSYSLLFQRILASLEAKQNVRGKKIGSETFIAELLKSMYEDGTCEFLFEIKKGNLASLFAYDIGRALGIDVRIIFDKGRVIANAGDFLLPTQGFEEIELERGTDWSYAKEIGQVIGIIYRSEGEQKLNNNEYEAALELFKSAREFLQSDPEICNSIGLSLFYLKRFEDAPIYFKKAAYLSEDPKHQAVFHYNAAMARMRIGGMEQYKEALNDCEKAIGCDPKNSLAYVARAKINLEMGQNMFDAIEDCDTAVSIEPNPDAFFLRAYIRTIIGDRKGAAEDELKCKQLLDPGKNGNA